MHKKVFFFFFYCFFLINICFGLDQPSVLLRNGVSMQNSVFISSGYSIAPVGQGVAPYSLCVNVENCKGGPDVNISRTNCFGEKLVSFIALGDMSEDNKKQVILSREKNSYNLIGMTLTFNPRFGVSGKDPLIKAEKDFMFLNEEDNSEVYRFKEFAAHLQCPSLRFDIIFLISKRNEEFVYDEITPALLCDGKISSYVSGDASHAKLTIYAADFFHLRIAHKDHEFNWQEDIMPEWQLNYIIQQEILWKKAVDNHKLHIDGKAHMDQGEEKTNPQKDEEQGSRSLCNVA